MKFLAIKNFERFQHYKDRAPLWIKLHNSLLSDFAFLCLPEAAQAQLLKLWLVASRLDNRIPNEPGFIRAQIGTRARLYLPEIINAGFLVETDEPASPVRSDWSSRYVPEEVRARVLARTDGRCSICGSMADVEIDHITPISKGGKGEESNLQGLCRKCNRRKRNRVATATRIGGTAEQHATQIPEPAEPREEKSQSREESSSSAHGDSEESEFRDAMSDVEQGKAFTGLAVQLPTVADQKALSAVIKACGNPTAWLSEMAVSLDGMHGPALTVKQLGEALRDYVGNGHHERPSFRHFRAYLRHPDRPSNGAKPHGMTPGERTYQNAMAAIPDTPGDGESR